MKSVEEYINEKQNFIFGGKSGLTGKEYGEEDVKTFEDLKKGDTVYIVQTHKDSIVLRKKEKFYKINLDPADCYIVFKEDGRSSVLPFDLDYISDSVCVQVYYIYSTYELSDAEAIELAKSKMKKK